MRQGMLYSACSFEILKLTFSYQIPTYSLLLISPALLVHSFSAVYFAYFYRYKQKPQPPHLELVRIAFVCIPIVFIMIGAWLAKREDVRMNFGLKSSYLESQAEPMLHSGSVDLRSIPPYDPYGHKATNLVEVPILMSPRARMWAPQGQNWVSQGYENVPADSGHHEQIYQSI